MNFNDAMLRYTEFKTQWQSGQISREIFEQYVYQLRVQDLNGTWWQIDPVTGGWLKWNGSTWVFSETSPEIQETKNCCLKCNAPLLPETKLCTSCGSPVESEKIYSHIPDDQTTYKCPECRTVVIADFQFCTECGTSLEKPKEQSGRTDTDKTSRFLKWNQRIWDVITMAGSTVLAGLWYWYSGLANRPDTATALSMLLLPLALILTRPLTDKLLMPLQKVKRKIPRMVLLGIGLAIPLLVSNFFYKFWYGNNTSSGNQEYDFMLKTFVTSVMLSYVVLRTPRYRQKMPRPEEI